MEDVMAVFVAGMILAWLLWSQIALEDREERERKRLAAIAAEYEREQAIESSAAAQRKRSELESRDPKACCQAAIARLYTVGSGRNVAVHDNFIYRSASDRDTAIDS